MADLTNYLRDKLNDHAFRATSYTVPASVWLALFTAATDANGGGTEVTPTGSGPYARQQLTLSTSSGGDMSNTGPVTFAGMPGVSVTHWAVMDSSSNGNMLAQGAFTSTITVTSGNDLTFGTNDIAFEMR